MHHVTEQKEQEEKSRVNANIKPVNANIKPVNDDINPDDVNIMYTQNHNPNPT